MDFVWVVLGIAVVAVALYFTATVLFGPGEAPQPAGEDLASPLPMNRDLTADDLRATVLPVTARGYRMSDVDALIDRMAAQLARGEQLVNGSTLDDPPGSRQMIVDLLTEIPSTGDVPAGTPQAEGLGEDQSTGSAQPNRQA